MNKYLVSVILPTYNRAYILKRAIDSVIKQTFKDWELIIIDDNSTDNTRKIVDNYHDKRIRYIKNSQNLGGAESRNVGINITKGTYIAFLDSDDEWLATKLQKQVLALGNNKNIGGVYVDFHTNNSEKTPSYLPEKEEGYIYQELLRANFITLPSLMVRKECLQKVGLFDKSLPRLQDWDLLLRLSQRYEISCLPEKLLNVYYSKDSITANQEAYTKALEIILNKYKLDFLKNKKIYSKHLFNLANNLSYEKDSGTRLTYFLFQAWKYDFYNLKYLLVFLVSLFGRKIYNIFLRKYKAI